MKKSIARGIRISFNLASIVILLICFSSCNLFNLGNEKPSKNLTIGVETEVASQEIPSTGGTVIINAPGNAIDGMTIVVPPNSYSTSKTFTITTAEITGHNLGEYFNPITPLIQIENGGGYCDSIMEITIPITITDGEIPLGFYYDEITGKLEAIPVKDYTPTSITLLTRHFMPASELSASDDKLKGIGSNASANLIISSISESVLKKQTIISSGFKMQVDNWEFENRGTYIAPGGQCAGQNMTSMWYYFEKKMKGEGQLFGKFSTVPSIYEDNALGYRFCSVIHKDLAKEGEVIDFFDKYIDKNQSLDKMKFYAIAGAMLTTGEPQGIGIYRTKDDDNNGILDTYKDGSLKYGGHDLICYQVGIDEGKLYICDPNYPNAGQFIEFINDKFEPYLGKDNATSDEYNYPFVTWYAKTAWIDWPQIGNRYAELLDSTIGNKAPNIFPPYTIWVKDKADSQLKNGYSTNNDTLRCMVECPTTERGFNIDGKWYIWQVMTDINGKVISVDEGSGKKYTLLKPGLNKIGFYIYSQRESASYLVNGIITYKNRYIDFKWFNVYYSKLEISPNPIVGKPDEDIKITAMSGGTAPKDAKFIWNFGDGSSDVTVINDSTITHKFTKDGNYTVSVDLYDNSTKKLIKNATTEANISNTTDLLIRLKQTKSLKLGLVGYLYQGDIIDADHNTGSMSFNTYNNHLLVWSALSFSYSSDTVFTYNLDHESITLSGTISADGMTIKLLNFEYHSENAEREELISKKFTIIDVPIEINSIDWGRFLYSIYGSTTKQHVTSLNIIESGGLVGYGKTIYSTSFNPNFDCKINIDIY